MRREWHNGVEAHWQQGADGAARFAAGLGRRDDAEHEHIEASRCSIASAADHHGPRD
jgi:hypothetical protein